MDGIAQGDTKRLIFMDIEKNIEKNKFLSGIFCDTITDIDVRKKRGCAVMEDVLFYQNYTPVADVSTIAICVIYFCLLQSAYTIKQKNLVMFQMANFLVLLAAASSICFHHLIDSLSEANILWVYITRDTAYISLILTYAIFCIYIRNLINMKGISQRILDVSVWSAFTVFAVLEIIAPFIKWGFYIDSDLQIHQNYYLDIFRFSYIYYTAVTAILLTVYRRKFITKMFQCLRSVMIISFLIMTLQASFLQTSYTCISFTFPIMAVLFLFHYNSYDADTGTLDVKAFNSYIKDMKNKRFSMIYLSLRNMNVDMTQEMSGEFVRFSEKFFRNSCMFRLGEDKFVMVYQDEQNKRADKKIPILMEHFEHINDRYRMEYRIVFIHSDRALAKGSEYLALSEFIEEKLPLNTIYQCQKKDIDDYLEAVYILSELWDIHVCQNLDDERVKVYCQPVLNTVTNTFTSAEALMRIELPGCGIVYPEQFIPLAEKYEYIHILSKIILNKTCKQIKELERRGYWIERVSVNFSMIELRNRNFCDDVINIIRDNEIEYGKIAIELTESRSEKDFENVKNVMNNLKGLGMKFYLDDFGTGYSNFERIIGLPIDIIKFDRSLTILAGKDEGSRFLVGSFSDIFKKSNYQILFEGVENERDETQCKEMNALYLQGYKYSKPIPMDQLTGFLRKQA